MLLTMRFPVLLLSNPGVAKKAEFRIASALLLRCLGAIEHMLPSPIDVDPGGSISTTTHLEPWGIALTWTAGLRTSGTYLLVVEARAGRQLRWGFPTV